MRVLVLGATGMFGHKLVQRLSPRFEVRGTVRGDTAQYADHPVLGGHDLIGGVDVTDLDRLREAVSWAEGGAVVNAIGVVKQLAAAREAIPNITINSLHPHRAAEACRAVGARFIHLSTDCVFSGRKGSPYTEDDETDPTDLYGRSKLLGEVDGEHALTIRTSIVGREIGRGAGLFEWCIAQRGGTIRGFTRAIYSGLTTGELSDLIGRLIADHPEVSGIQHVSSDPIDKCALLGLLNEALELDITIEPDESFACDRSLDSTRFRTAVGYTPPSWAEMVQVLADDPTPYSALHDTSRP